MYDRLTGSTTMIISSGGTTIPGSPTRPEYLKANVYLPPAFVTHNPDLHRPLVDIVQHYIESVGVRTVNLWTQRARRDLGYSLTQVGNPQQNQHVNTIPCPDYNSAHYTFLGQPYRIMEDPSAGSFQAPSQASSTDSYAEAFGEDPDASTLVIIDLQEEIRELHERIHNLEQERSDLEEEVKVLNLRNSSLTTRTHDRIQYLERQIQIQRYAADQTTSSPVRNLATKPASSKTPLTPSRYRSATPSLATPTRAKIPDLSFKHHFQPSPPSVSRTLISSRQASPLASQGLASPHAPLLPCYIDLYHLRDLSRVITLIGNYTPVESRIEELLKLGLEKEVCDALAEAMALDKA